MTDRLYDTTQISRRKVLAGLGTIGVAAAGAGIGTSAFFSDQENFEGNRLVAGTLDMKIDWEEHYSDWSPDEAEFAGMGDEEDFDYSLPALDAEGNLMTDARPIWLTFNGETAGEKDAAQDSLWNATTTESFPDDDNNATQDEFTQEEACDILGDVGDIGEGFEDALSSDSRTEGEFAGQTTAPGDPLIDLDDVKPGDFGEVTFSFHLCDNPGYVWLNGDLVSAAENGHEEPEAADPDTVGPSDEESGPEDLATSQVEILDAINTRVWYDDGDNQLESIRGELDIMLALDASGSIDGTVDTDGSEASNLVEGVEAFVDALPTDGSVQIGQVVFGENNDVTRFSGLGPVSGYSIDYPNNPDGNTPLPAAIDIATNEIESSGRSSADNVVVVFTDGAPNYENQTYSADGYTAPRNGDWSADNADQAYDNAGSDESQGEQEETALVAALARNETRLAVVNVGTPPDRTPNGAGTPKDLDVYLEDDIASAGFYFEVDPAVLASVAGNLVAAVAVGEELIVQGTLREALTILGANDGRGIPLDGDRSTAFDELADPENDPDRECFAGDGESHYVAFEWWLPINHANQIQGDSVSFDLGFYTEQCRHNDGRGMVPENEEQVTTEDAALTAD